MTASLPPCTITALVAKTAEREWDLDAIPPAFPHVTFNILRLGHPNTFFSYDPQARFCELLQDDKRVDFSSSLFLYFPYNYSLPYRLLRSSPPAHSHTSFIDSQWEAVTDFIEYLLDISDTPCINRPRFARLAANKMISMAAAQKLGIPTPITVFANQPFPIITRFTDFPIVGKVVAYNILVDEDHIIPTSLLSSDECHDEASLSLAPICFQSFHFCKTQLRSYVLGERVITVRLVASSMTAADIDIRLHKNVTLDISISHAFRDYERQLLSLCQSLQITYAAVDSLLIEDGPLFLDLNPHGTWMWLPEAVRLEISQGFIDMIATSMRSLSR